MNTIRRIGAALLLCTTVVAGGVAHATTRTFQPAAGHVFDDSGAARGSLSSHDGYVFSIGGVSRKWTVYLPLTVTNLSYKLTQNADFTGVSGGVQSRALTYNSDGSLFGYTAYTTAATVGTVFVPSNGTLEARTVFTCDSVPGVICPNLYLNSFSVTY